MDKVPGSHSKFYIFKRTWSSCQWSDHIWVSLWVAGWALKTYQTWPSHCPAPQSLSMENHRPTKPNHFVMVSFLKAPFLFVVGSQEGLRSFWSFLHWLSVLFPVFLRVFLLQVLFRGFSEILSKNISCISWNILRVRKATYGWMEAGKQNELIKIRNKWKTITFHRLHAQRHNCDNISMVKSNLSCMPCVASLSAGGEIKQTVI